MDKIKIGGKNRPFHFGTNSSAILEKETGVGITNLGDKLSGQESKFQIGFLRDLFWSCLQAGEYIYGEGEEISKWKVGEWIDDIEIDQVEKGMEIIKTGMPKWSSSKKKPTKKKKKKK